MKTALKLVFKNEKLKHAECHQGLVNSLILTCVVTNQMLPHRKRTKSICTQNDQKKRQESFFSIICTFSTPGFSF